MNWWGRRRKAAESHKTAPVSDLQPTRVHLNAPTGHVVWVCATPTGRVGCTHDTEAQAKWHGKDVWWPEVIDDEGHTMGETA